MKKENIKYVVGGSMVGFGILLVIISVCIGGWGMLKDFHGFTVDWDGVHYYYGNEEQTYSEVNKMDKTQVKNLDFDIDYGELIVKTADVQEIEIHTKDVTEKRFSYNLDGDTLEVTYGGGFAFFTWRANSVITVTLPKDMEFDKAEFKGGAGRTEITGINAKEIKMENGAGELIFTDIKAENKLKIDNGAGTAKINNITCGELKINGGVGEIIAKNTVCTDIDIDNGIGAFEYEGEINGNAKIDNGIGEVRMNIKGNSSDYNFKVDSGVGQVKVNGNTPIEYNNAKYDFKVNTGVGDVRINFE